ncbi:SDR family oxidoreductase [Streptomyces sp. NPDC008086]|uniref:SDR family oxidoreductase n=1 Tax=Streptomyces sp. NPDC008086 TaxID=3364807 RepID=UPI0036F0DDEC
MIAIIDRVAPLMRSRGWGRIITSASSGVIAPIPDLGLSNALRASLLGWSKTLAREVAADGVTCNVVVPGRIGTQRTGFLDRAKAEREGKFDLPIVVVDRLAGHFGFTPVLWRAPVRCRRRSCSRSRGSV